MDKDPEYETYTEVETLNSMVPIWTARQKSEVTDEEIQRLLQGEILRLAGSP